MNILSIGNSFSQDARRCRFMRSEEQAHTLQMCGSSTGNKASLKKTLLTVGV